MSVILNKQDVSHAPAAATSYILDVDAHSFASEVVDASQTQLVIADCWAPWCGPCKQIGTILEKLVRGFNGSVRLARINIDEAPQLAVQLHVQSIPAVLAFYQGRLVDGFMGALPETQIKNWIGRLIKVTGISEIGDETGPTIEDMVRAADQYLSDGLIEESEKVYADILKQDPKEGRAFAGVLRCLVAQGKTETAAEILEQAAPELRNHKAVDAVRSAIDLARETQDARGALSPLVEKVAASPNDHQARFDLALAYYAEHQPEKAIEELLEIVQRDRKWNNDAARKQLLKIFDVLGFAHPLAVNARKRLSSILFS